MSKLYNEYLKQKSNDSKKVYLFKSGIFYIALEDDAFKLSEIFNFKITNLNEDIVKCGFPQKRLDFYTTELISQNITFEIIDLNYSKIENYSDYLNNIKLSEIIQSIINLDMDNISFREAFDFLYKTKEELLKIYKEK